MASEEENKQDDVVSIELPAPAGWVKKFTPKKGGTPQRSDIVFMSPTGEEIKNKRQLDQFLKSHPGGPAASEFDWGSGDTPRRSARLSEKLKAVEAPTSESPTKRKKKSSPEEADGKGNAYAEEDGATDEKDPEVSVVDAKGAGDVEFTVAEEAIPEKPVSEKAETKTEVELVPEKPDFEEVETKTEAPVVPAELSTVETQNDGNTENLNGDNHPVVGDGKVDCGGPVVEDKEIPKEIHEGGKPVEQESTTGS